MMMHASTTANFQEVLHKELEDIKTRRKQAGLVAHGASGDVRLATVGLALSGGGVRSGAVGLGLLQALYDERILNQFDYLSTVSGGGYAGVLLTANLAEFPTNCRIDWGLGDFPGDQDQSRKLTIASDASRTQPSEVRRLIYNGMYLRKFHELISATLFGVVLNWAMLLGGLTAAACGVAWLIKWLDHPRVSAVTEALGFSNDLRRAFFVPFVLGGFWLFAQLLHTIAKSPSRQAKWGARASWLSLALIASLACGFVIVLTTADLDMRSASGPQAAQSTVEATNSLQTWAGAVLVLVLLVSLMPFLRRNDLLQSGTVKASKPWHPWIAKIAGWGMLVGVPLFLFGLVAQENLFRYNEQRPDRHQLARLNVRDWIRFAHLLESEATLHPNGPSARLWEVTRSSPDAQVPTKADAGRLDAIVDAEHRRRELQNHTWFVSRCLSLPKLLWQDGTVYQHWQARTESDRYATTAVRLINEKVLADPKFYKRFPPQLPVRVSNASNDAYTAAVEHARQVASRAGATNILTQIEDLKTRVADASPQDRPTLETQLTEQQRMLPQVEEVNRELLQLWYGDLLRPASTVFALNVLRSDQTHRLIIGGLALLLFLGIGLAVDVNLTSAHVYYRQRLAEMWLHRQTRAQKSLDLLAMKNTDHGGPYHLINATVNLLGPQRCLDEEPTEGFLFSRRFCGSDRVEYEPTDTYQRHGVTLADAMAISGAAVSPAAVLNNPALFYAMLLTNARLGKWVPNPGDNEFPAYPTFIRAVMSYLRNVPEDAEYLYVSDGGHHENSGIEALLQRRAKVIVACDASQDMEHQFLDLLRLFRRMSTLRGIRFQTPQGKQVSFDALAIDPTTKVSREHCVLIKVLYPGNDNGEQPETGWLLYVKSTLTAANSPELLKYRDDNKNFPFDPTLDQFYDARRFECYRRLGYELGLDVARRLNSKQQDHRTLWLSKLDLSEACSGSAVDVDEKPKGKAKSSKSAPAEFIGIPGPIVPFLEAEIANAPACPGVFLFYRDEEMVDLHRTKNLNQELRSKWGLRGTLRPVSGFKFEPNEKPRKREAEIANEFKRAYGRLPAYMQS